MIDTDVKMEEATAEITNRVRSRVGSYVRGSFVRDVSIGSDPDTILVPPTIVLIPDEFQPVAAT